MTPTATPTPYGVEINGRRYNAADLDDGGPAVYVHLDYAHAPDRDPFTLGDPDRDPMAHAAIFDTTGAVTIYTCSPTGEFAVDPDPECGPVPVHAWTADDDGTPMDADTAARLDAALDDVNAAWETFHAADLAMGDPNP